MIRGLAMVALFALLGHYVFRWHFSVNDGWIAVAFIAFMSLAEKLDAIHEEILMQAYDRQHPPDLRDYPH